MELSLSSINLVSVSLLAAFLLLVLKLVTGKKNGAGQKLPPGPPGWPVVGNMFQLGILPQKTLYDLRSKYGPVVWMQLGSVNTMVVQTAAAAAVLFKEHDVVFSDRKQKEGLNAFRFNDGSLGQARFGADWRVLRRLCSSEFMVNKRLNDTTDIRRRLEDNLVRWIDDEARSSSGEVEVGRFFFLVAFNLIGNLLLSRDLMDAKDPESKEFFKCMNKIVELAGTPNVADFLPWLKWLDPSGVRRGIHSSMVKTMKVTTRFVQERLEQRKSKDDHKRKKDFLDTLLEYEGDGKGGPERMTLHNAQILIMEMFFAGSETTSISIEWGFVEMLRNPHVMQKVRNEIDTVIGLHRKVEESDFERLPYLQAVVKETLRLHPVLPLLLPRNTTEDTKYMGYFVPKDTQVFVNAWAIGRDPAAWDDPLTFKPERFLGSDIEYKGQDFQLIPFGSGRRICVGFPLAHRVVHLTLATIIQNFDWELPAGVTPKSIDMEEKFGLTLRKKIPMKAVPRKRSNLKF
ncbi:hypothetical protein LguiA_016021 [Lonicera macranthoides]